MCCSATRTSSTEPILPTFTLALLSWHHIRILGGSEGWLVVQTWHGEQMKCSVVQANKRGEGGALLWNAPATPAGPISQRLGWPNRIFGTFHENLRWFLFFAVVLSFGLSSCSFGGGQQHWLETAPTSQPATEPLSPTTISLGRLASVTTRTSVSKTAVRRGGP